MIMVHVSKTWPDVLAGTMTAADATLGAWSSIADTAVATYGDVVAGIYDNMVVSVFDTHEPRFERGADNKVTFIGSPSTTWEYLIGTPNPGKPWGVRGYARPVQYLDSAVVAHGDAALAEIPGGQRAVVDGYILTISGNSATLVVPAGREVTVITSSPGPAA